MRNFPQLLTLTSLLHFIRSLLLFTLITLTLSLSLPLKLSGEELENSRHHQAAQILKQLQAGEKVSGFQAIGPATLAPGNFQNFLASLARPHRSSSKWPPHSPIHRTFLKQLFHDLVRQAGLSGISLELTPLDLFHGHVFIISPQDLGIIFHAKEYPNDPDMVYQNGGRGRNSPFSTHDRDYHLRNFLWILSQNQFWVFKGTLNPHPLQSLLLPPHFHLEETDPDRRDIVSLFLKAKTLQETYFFPQENYIGSVYYHPEADPMEELYLTR